jgi:hypothetical protein
MFRGVNIIRRRRFLYTISFITINLFINKHFHLDAAVIV